MCVCVRAWSVVAVAREPRNVQHTFIIISNNITARLSWDEPDSDVLLSGYRVVWGQLVQSDPIQMDSAALTKVLPKVCSNYLINVQAPSATDDAQTDRESDNVICLLVDTSRLLFEIKRSIIKVSLVIRYKS